MLMCRPHWFTLPRPLRDQVWRTWRRAFNAEYRRGVGPEKQREINDEYREAVRGAVAYLNVVPMRGAPFPAEDPKPTLKQVRDHIELALAERKGVDMIIGALKEQLGARYRFYTRYRFYSGTYELRALGVSATCTAGGVGLLRAWQRAAERKLAKAGEVS